MPNQKQKISTLAVMDRMATDDNKEGIQMSKTLIDANDVEQGYIISFGVDNTIGADAFQQTLGLPGEYIIFCMAVKRTELDKTRKIMEAEIQGS